MPDTLHLEYAATPAEMREAQELNTRQRVGGGSAWLTRTILSLVLLSMCVTFYFRVREEVPPAYQAYAYAAIVVLVVAVYAWVRRVRHTAPGTCQLDVTGEGIAILGPASRVTMPWTAFCECLESPALFVLIDRPKAMMVVVPKRAFPDDAARDWFRAVAYDGRRQPVVAHAPSPVPTGGAGSERLTISLQLGFRDYVDLARASWRTWAVFWLVAALIVGTGLYGLAHPPPDAVVSGTLVFFVMTVPFLLVMLPVAVYGAAYMNWRSHRQYLKPVTIILDDDGIEFAGADAAGRVPWNAYAHYKETGRSFIMWKGVAWQMLPKRVFTCLADQRRCRALLAAHLRESRWFFV